MSILVARFLLLVVSRPVVPVVVVGPEVVVLGKSRLEWGSPGSLVMLSTFSLFQHTSDVMIVLPYIGTQSPSDAT